MTNDTHTTTDAPPELKQRPGVPSADSAAPAWISVAAAGTALAAWTIPIIGLAASFFGMVIGASATKSRHRRLALLGVALSSLTLILSAGNLAVQTYWLMFGEPPPG